MRNIIFLSFLSLTFITNSNSSSEDVSYIKAKVHNIGQGNCITAELFDADEGESIYFLMDAGSSAFKKELYCQKYFLKKKESIEQAKAFAAVEPEEYEASSPPRTSTPSAIPPSVVRLITPGEQRVSQNKPSGSNKDIKDEIVKEIRIALGMKNIKKNSPIKVTTFLVSHPDSDHYNFFGDIFNNKRDIIQNIILGGLPQNYSYLFRNWLQQQIDDIETKVYFPALTFNQPISSIDAVLRECEKLEGVMYSSLYAPQMFSHPEERWKSVDHLEDFEKDLPFSKNIKTYLLSINPTHWKEEGKEVARGSFSDDDNSDSLVIKLQVGEHSIIITGDATELTTGRILRNYKDHPNFLKSTIITSDHHGSRTHGSNNLPWIRATAPQYVIFSCGIMHGHPSLHAYENSKESPNLVRTEPHDIWVWEGTEKTKEDGDVEETYTRGKKVRVHATHQSLFSTFSSGTLTFTLPETGEISVESQILDFDSKKLGPKKQYKTSLTKEKSKVRSEEKAVDIEVGEDELKKIEKSFLEEADTALSSKGIQVSPRFPFVPSSPYDPRRQAISKDEEESSSAPLLQVGKRGTYEKRGQLFPSPSVSAIGKGCQPPRLLYHPSAKVIRPLWIKKL